MTPLAETPAPIAAPVARPNPPRVRDDVLRMPIAAASAAAAIAHVPVTGEHLAEAPYIGALFVALEVAYLALAAIVCRRPTRSAYIALVGISAAALLALVLSRTTGLPQLMDDIGNWTDPLAVLSLVAEWIVLSGSVVVLFGLPSPTARERLASVMVAGLMLVAGVVLVGVATTLGEQEGASVDGRTSDMSGDMSGMDMGMPRLDPAPR